MVVGLNAKIKELDQEIRRRLDLGMDLTDLQTRRRRLINYRNNFPEIMNHLQNYLSVDIRGENLERNFEKIVEGLS